jgi:hypothetical protein
MQGEDKPFKKAPNRRPLGPEAELAQAPLVGISHIKGIPAITGRSTSGTVAGLFEGNVEVSVGNLTINMGKLSVKDMEVQGNIKGSGETTLTCFDVRLAGQDCAENFDISGLTEVDAGTVMVIDDAGTLSPCQDPYDKKVTGVISGAGNYKPGLILGQEETPNNRQPIALLGKVYCKADAQYGAIEVGDMLTTSPVLGHAMKASDPQKAFGAVIGKALRPLKEGQGLIPILIALQ